MGWLVIIGLGTLTLALLASGKKKATERDDDRPRLRRRASSEISVPTLGGSPSTATPASRTTRSPATSGVHVRYPDAITRSTSVDDDGPVTVVPATPGASPEIGSRVQQAPDDMPRVPAPPPSTGFLSFASQRKEGAPSSADDSPDTATPSQTAVRGETAHARSPAPAPRTTHPPATSAVHVRYPGAIMRSPSVADDGPVTVVPPTPGASSAIGSRVQQASDDVARVPALSSPAGFLGFASQRKKNAPSSAEEAWVPPGRTVVVDGLQLPGGMLYVGSGLRGRSPQITEPALIDPTLRVDRANPDFEGVGLTYWPSYSELSPQSRAAYLLWLADGRSNQSVPIGYVFLFFYGIERRLFGESQVADAVRNEAPALVAEVERLLGRYGAISSSFRGYAERLLATARVVVAAEGFGKSDPAHYRGGYELALPLRLAIGAIIRDGDAIPGPWSLSWLMSHPERRLRTPAQRCKAEFEALFLRRYQQRYGDGMKIEANKTKLQWTYRPASAGFVTALEIDLDVPDIAPLQRPVSILQAIADKCMDDLDAFSRHLGKHPDDRHSVSALALLPTELASDRQDARTAAARASLTDLVRGSAAGVITGRDLIALWYPDGRETLSKKDSVEFAQLLGRINLGVEPDVRFGGPPVSASEQAILFEITGECPATSSEEYRSATLLLQLAVVVADADGAVVREEQEMLERRLEVYLKLSNAESARLRAHLRWLLLAIPGMSGLKKRIEGASAVERSSIAEFAVRVAGADGRIHPDEVKTLEKIYKALRLDPKQVFSDLHSLTQPMQSQPADSTKQKSRGGKPGKAAKELGSLDMALVERKRAETAAVETLLSSVFVDAVPDDLAAAAPALTTVPSDAGPAAVLGLDAGHSALLSKLPSQATISRSEFEILAEHAGVMSDGAFESLNESAFNHFDEPLLESDDPIFINVEVLERMRA